MILFTYRLFLFPTILLLVSASDRGFLIVQSDTQNKIVYSLLRTFDESIQKTLQTNSGDGAAEPPSDGEETTSTTTTTIISCVAVINILSSQVHICWLSCKNPALILRSSLSDSESEEVGISV